MPIDAQKQVSPGSVQFTAMMNSLARRAAYREPGLRQYPVLDRDRPQVAGPDAEEGVPRRLVIGAVAESSKPSAVRVARPQPLPRRVQEPLPALRPCRMAECGGVVAAAQPVPARLSRTPQPKGSSAAEDSSLSTIASSWTVGPITR